MLGTGKYDFPGIRKAGRTALEAIIGATGWGAWLLASPFKATLDFVLDYFDEWLANRGLILFNVGAIYLNGEFDQSKFDKAIEDGLANAKAPGLTDAQKKVIDDGVIESFRRFGRVSAEP